MAKVPTTAEERRRSLLEERKILTSKISDSVRFFGFGFLAIFYAVFTDGKKFETLLREQWYSNWLIFIVGSCGAMAILFDYLQYVAGAISVKDAMNREDNV